MWSYLIPTIALFTFGFFNLLGVKPSLAYIQLIDFVMALVIFIGVKKIGRNFFRQNSLFFYLVFIILLLVTFMIGFEAKGSKRWLDLYFFNFQASEFFKIFFILFFANFFAINRKTQDEPLFFLKAVVFFILPALIVFKQPDLGNALVYFSIFAGLIFFSNIPKKYLFVSVLCLLCFLPVFWLVLKEYQRLRIMSFINPHLDQQGTSYNMIQAIITIGAGKFFGRGLGLGMQTKLYFLPENHTDFAMASLVEQFGFLGGLLVIVFFSIIAAQLIKRIFHHFFQSGENSLFNFYFTLGFLVYFLTQVFVNIGMNLGVLPVAGIALPLISYGGSSLVTWMLGLALLP